MQLSLASPKTGKSAEWNTGSELHADAVIVNIWPPPATAILPQGLQPVFANATTGLRGVYGSSTLLPSATLPDVLSGTFAGQVDCESVTAYRLDIMHPASTQQFICLSWGVCNFRCVSKRMQL